MVSLIDVVRFLRTEFPELNIYPLEYPLNSPINSNKVEIQANTEAKAGLFPLVVQIKVKDDHPAKAEATSYEFRNLLENKTNFMIGNVQIVMVKSQNPVPLYIGKDPSGGYLYSNNFRFMVNEGV
ncbi:minor capsid protein [Bacillus cereus group sp. Bc015]|uniref:phage tail terminator protein n=1 Tax=Bacillus cereus group sp. Bc015 TaxID=3018123 RepID=UPI0022DFC7A3|nr:minor capsid protein [Bacillus cereus group sp. Bc015]MDA2738378.1 minor capsid protein [Bacillus cereus group sp. Bc015]